MKFNIKLILVSVFLVIEASVLCNAYRGLFVMTLGTKSHINFFRGIIEALVNNGHQITFIQPYDNSINHPNVTEIAINEDISKYVGNLFQTSFFDMMKMITEIVPELCVRSFTHPSTVEALKKDYDYVIMSLYFTTCYLGYVHERQVAKTKPEKKHSVERKSEPLPSIVRINMPGNTTFKCVEINGKRENSQVPLIYATPNVLSDPYAKRFGSIEFPAIYPSKMMPFVHPLTFLQRVISTFGSISYVLIAHYSESLTENLSRERGIWNSEIPTVKELHKHGSLVIINSIKALEIPIKPSPPNVVYAGGIHIRPTKPLPKDLQDWLDGSGDAGFILFSLGTAVRPADMKTEHRNIFLNVFRSLEQRVIWKWDSMDIENLPPNVKLSAWLPQQDILAHPKIRLFITHGGLLSTQEASYFGVPVIGMPVFGDQAANIAEVVSEDWGRRITWDELTEEKLKDIVMDALTNSTFRQTVVKRSELMKDWPRSPADEVVYWTEYVIRHKGAHHLHSPIRSTPWYIIYNIDVWFFVVGVLIFIVISTVLILRLCCRVLKRKFYKVKED